MSPFAWPGHTLYVLALRAYPRSELSHLSGTGRAFGCIVRWLVKIAQRLSGIRFPERAVGWWWTWRWKLEMLAGWHEYSTARACKELIKPGIVVVDAGAHVCYFTWLLSRLVGPTGKVVAYEPSPENLPLLLHNLHALRLENVVPLQVALSDRSGLAELFVSPGSSNHSLVRGYADACAARG